MNNEQGLINNIELCVVMDRCGAIFCASYCAVPTYRAERHAKLIASLNFPLMFMLSASLAKA